MTAPAGTADSARHPIAIVAERTGLSQDVLRVWERRYGAVQPSRDAGGQRWYSDADVARLALLAAATRAGRSIGQVARLDTAALSALVGEDEAARPRSAEPARSTVPPDAATTIDAALEAARGLDAAGVDDALRRSTARLGTGAFLEAVAAPLLRRVGDEWHAGRFTTAQEHLVSSIVHVIAVESLRGLNAPADAPRILVTTTAGERHAVGAAIVGAAAATEGWHVLYLGAELPPRDIAEAARAARVQAVAISIVYVPDRQRVLDDVRLLRGALPAGVTLLAGGAGAQPLEPALASLGARVASSVPGFVDELRRVPR